MKKFEYDERKMKELILYIVQQCPGIDTEKLNVILFYSDMYAYAKLGKPITGETYIRGPEPLKKRAKQRRRRSAVRGKAK